MNYLLLKKMVRTLFNFFGFEILSAKTGSRMTMGGFLSFLAKSGFQPQTVIDVGVAFGTPELYCNFPQAHHLLIEPLVEWQPVLEKICQQYDAEYVLAAAGAKQGIATINVHHDLSGSSIFGEAEGRETDGVTRKVPVVTIDDLCDDKNLKEPFLIKSDTQGYELNVLEGARKTMEKSELIILEVNLWQSMINSPQLHDVVIYMYKQGFVAFDMFGFSLRPLDNAMASIDFAFVKEHGSFRKCHHYCSAQQRRKHTEKLKSYQKYILRKAKYSRSNF